MRALQITAPERFEIVDIEEPSPAEGEVLIRMDAATICNQHDSKMLAGPHTKYPLEAGFPGHEGAGEVVALGPGVGELSVGDRVVTSGIGGPPLYRELVTRKEPTAVKYSADALAAEMAPLELFGCVHKAVRLASSVEGRRVAVIGLGPAGLACCQLLAACGAAEIVALDLDESRLGPAAECGATEALNAERFGPVGAALERLMRQEPPPPEAAGLMGELRDGFAPLVIECSGSPRSLETSFVLAGEELVIFGYTDKPFTGWQPVWFQRGLTIRNSRILSLDDLRAVTALADEGRIDPGRLVTTTMPFKRYGEAVALIREKRATKIALLWE